MNGRCAYAGCLGPVDGSECRHPEPTMTAGEIIAAIGRQSPGLPAVVEHSGGGCATVYVGTPTGPDSRYAVLIGPGAFDWHDPMASTFYPDELSVGRDDDGESISYYVTTAAAIAAAVRDILSGDA